MAPVSRLFGCVAVAVALVSVLVFFPGRASAHSGWTVAQMPINQEFTEYVPSNCYNRLAHGNIYSFAVSKVKYTTSQCYVVGTWVTGCSGYYCPSGATVRSYDINVWAQSQVQWVNVIYSHFFLQSDGGAGYEQHHRNVF